MADCFQNNTGLGWDFNKKYLPKNFQYLYINYCISTSYTSSFFTLYHLFDARDSSAGSLRLVNSSNETFTENEIPAPVANQYLLIRSRKSLRKSLEDLYKTCYQRRYDAMDLL